MSRSILILHMVGVALAMTADDRARLLLEKSGGKYVCRIDKPEWMIFYRMYWGSVTFKEQDFRDHLYSLVYSNYTQVFECNVGVIAGYVRIARLAQSSANDELAYRSYQMAMVFIYTLRNRQKIPIEQELLWRISTDEVVRSIQFYKSKIHFGMKNTIAQLEAVQPARIGIVSICAYPEDHPLILKDITPRNRREYAMKHGYRDVVLRSHPFGNTSDICIQHSKLALMATLLESGEFDWLMWMDCDSIIVNHERRIADIITEYALPGSQILITEELLGLSSANWIIRRSDWSVSFLRKAFKIANEEIPFFGDQDAMISLAIGSGTLDSHVRIIPQNEINTYDALNAFFMGSKSYGTGDLLITFPQCKDIACNSLFSTAFNASLDNAGHVMSKPLEEKTWEELRVFGPGDVIAKMYRDQLG